ncbi:MAG: hypothetical protein NZ742_06945 [Acidobacteria bacterium]|nr:hypothetical protein [Acidobacteriota bacterium]MDW7984592.1 hypothetical protein [Acidobacteriota bacterium]
MTAASWPGLELADRLIKHFQAYTEDTALWSELWLVVFRYQAAYNPVYRRYVQRLGVEPAGVRDWRGVPFVPGTLFKTHWVGAFPQEQAQAVFYSSGTQRGLAGRSVHPFFRLELYRSAALSHFQRWVLPDRDRIRMLLLGPSARHRPESSLGQMLDWLMEAFAVPESLHAWTADGPDFEGATRWLAGADASSAPVLIFGTAMALYEWLLWMETRGFRPKPLPSGSRLVETGGFKGRRVAVTKEELYTRLSQTLGIPEAFIIAEYGMTELGSQFYDATLRATLEGRSTHRHLVGPPWVHVAVWDPETWRPVEPPATGPLAFIDPANLDSLAFIVTEDVGTVDSAGLTLLGRLPEAEPRGCSLLA